MNLPDNITVEQAYILGYEDGFKEATEVVTEVVADSDQLPDGTRLGKFPMNNEEGNLWRKLKPGDIIVRSHDGWVVDNGRVIESNSRYRCTNHGERLWDDPHNQDDFILID